MACGLISGVEVDLGSASVEIVDNVVEGVEDVLLGVTPGDTLVTGMAAGEA